MTLRLVKQDEVLSEAMSRSEILAAWEEAFHAVFWPAYHKLRRGLPNPKGAALALWRRVRDQSEENFQRVMVEFRACEAAWREAGTEAQYIPHARKWLHDRIVNGVFYGSEGGERG